MKKTKKQNSNAFSGSAANSSRVKGGGLSKAFSLSIIISLIDRFTNFIYNSLIKGFFGRIFTAYSSEQSAFERGYVKNYFGGTGKFKKHFRSARMVASKHFETSFFVRKLGDMTRFFLSSPLKFYGNFLFSFGVYSALVFFIRELIPELVSVDKSFIAVSAILILISLPLLTSKESLCMALGSGRITRLLFSDAFGFTEEEFQMYATKGKRRSNIAIFLGMLLGILTVFLNPMYIILGIGALIASAVVIAVPEIGVVSTLFMIPFFSIFENPTLILACNVVISVIGYVIKLIRGKRVFKIEILDLFVMFFIVTIYMGGVITAGGVDSMLSATMTCILIFGYFLVVNLMRTERWINRCVTAIVSSSVIVAVIGVMEYIFGYAERAWIDTSYFSDINGRVVSLFDNPNVLSAYLAMAFPLLLAKTATALSRKGKALGVISSIIILACIVLTWSRSAWVAVILSVVLFSLINRRKTVRALLAIGIILPIIPYFVGGSVTKRFMSIGDLADSSSYYRLYTWKGTIDAIKDYFWSGAGYGASAYAEIYPQYAYAGIEAVEHSHNLFLQILFSVGIFGLLVFLAVLFLFAQKNFEFFKVSKDAKLKLMASAAFSAVFTALIIGMFDYVWYNFRLLLMFWIMMAISCAYIRFGDREAMREHVINDYTPESASLDM